MSKLREMVRRIIKEETSSPMQKYKDFVKREGHLVSTSSDIFEDWIDKEGNSLSLKDAEIVLKQMFGNNDVNAYERGIRYAKKNGLR